MTNDPTMMMLLCGCGQKMKVPVASYGKTCKCVKCGESLTISTDNTKQIAVEPLAGSRETGPGPSSAAAPPSAPPPVSAARGATNASESGRIGQLLIAQGLITQAQLHEALAAQAERGGKTFEILIELGHLDKKALHEFFSKQPGVASIDLANYQIDSNLIEMIPRDFALQNVILPIDKLGKLLTVGMACPLDTVTIKAVEEMTGLRVKAMLCKLDDILTAVKRYYRDAADDHEATLDSFGLSKVAPAKPTSSLAPVEQLETLPPSPNTLQRLREAASAHTPVPALAAIVRFDPPLVAQILSVANAEVYGFAGRVNTLGLALTLLGAQGVHTLASCESSGNGKDSAPVLDVELLGLRSAFCAEAARAIAKTCLPDKTAVAYTAGLLHELGRFALAKALQDRYSKIDKKLCGTALIKAEKLAVNITHPEAGYTVAGKWRLPADLVELIRHHHSPEKATQDKELAAIVAVASAMAEAYTGTGEAQGDALAGSADLLKTLRLDKAAAERIFKEAAAALQA